MPHNALVTRVRSEYREMPGLRLTLEQAKRLFGVERTLCKRVLDALVEANFLSVRQDGAYVRMIDGDVGSHPAQADLVADRRVGKASISRR